MSLDLTNARNAYINRVKQIEELALVERNSLPEGVTPPRDAMNRISPYAIIHFGRPQGFSAGTLADGERDTPHIWPTWVELYGPQGYDIDALCDKLDALLEGWSPDGDNSTEMRAAGSYSYGITTSDTVPARDGINRYYTCLVNMQRG